jgi:vacuolar-type H+-ATPase subunit F/Vma7
MEKSMSLLVLSPWGADIGFRLGGADVVAISGSNALNGAIANALKSGNIGALAIPEIMEDSISPENRNLLSKRLFPMVVFYPIAKEWKASEVSETEIEEIIYRAVGYRMRIKT